MSEELKRDLLQIFFDAYPSPLLSESLARRHQEVAAKYGKEAVVEAQAALLNEGFLIAAPGGLATIGPKGMLWLAQQVPNASWAELQNINKTVIELTAKLAEVRDAAETSIAKAAEKQRVELAGQIAAQQRSFYTTLIPIFTLFVAVIAIVVSAAQAASRVVADGNPGLTALQATAVMGPTAGAVLLMVLVVWGIIWLMTRG